MENLNYKHLKYFWMVAKTGSIARASEQLFLSPQSISGQLGELENNLGVQLLHKVGRGLELTDMGRRIYSYADEIFAIGSELVELTQNQTFKKDFKFRIGITDSVFKTVAYRVIEPVLRIEESVHLICTYGKLSRLLAEMSINQLDLVIADRPMPTNYSVRAHNHLLGESKLAIFATKNLLENYKDIPFPAMLNQAPYLMQGDDFSFKKDLLAWFDSHKLYPHIVGEFDDGAMLKSFGQAGAGFFAAPLAIADFICYQYEVELVGEINNVIEQLYAITTERRLTHPAFAAIVQATANIFAKPT